MLKTSLNTLALAALLGGIAGQPAVAQLSAENSALHPTIVNTTAERHGKHLPDQ